jgi:anti-sigma B factor antagonist
MADLTNLKTTVQGGVIVASVTAPKVSDFEAPGLRTDLAKLAADNRGRLILDISQVLMLTSAGLGMLTAVRQACVGAKGSLVITGASKDILEMLRITNLHKLLTLKPTIAEALEVFK